MTERQKMFLEIAERCDVFGINNWPIFICLVMDSFGYWRHGKQFRKLIRGFKEGALVLYTKSDDESCADTSFARATLCCLLAAMSDEEYEELTK